MITGIENIRDIFSIFHDGTIVDARDVGCQLLLRVEIPYLAKMVNKDYEYFEVTLFEVRNLQFSTWPDDIDDAPKQILGVHEIFKPELEILSAEIEDDLVCVVCNQHSSEYKYCGGILKFKGIGGVVKDPLSIEYSIDELDTICNKYWTDWASRS